MCSNQCGLIDAIKQCEYERRIFAVAATQQPVLSDAPRIALLPQPSLTSSPPPPLSIHQPVFSHSIIELLIAEQYGTVSHQCHGMDSAPNDVYTQHNAALWQMHSSASNTQPGSPPPLSGLCDQRSTQLAHVS
jgi:hypothetical protein